MHCIGSIKSPAKAILIFDWLETKIGLQKEKQTKANHTNSVKVYWNSSSKQSKPLGFLWKQVISTFHIVEDCYQLSRELGSL